jgi:bifunctional enzyme CysN/CysC
MGQKPCVVWFTGISAAGKSTIANCLRKAPRARTPYLSPRWRQRSPWTHRDLGFAAADRVENIRRVADVARLMVDAGLIVLVSFISPFETERRMARGLVEVGEFFEVFVDTPLDVAESRDPKGLYRRARKGMLRDFTGIDSPYERPENPEIRLDTTTCSAEQAAMRIAKRLRALGRLDLT